LAARSRIAVVETALASSEPLAKVREVIAETNKEQRVVVWAFACVLETHSAGLLILLDRFTGAELGRMEKALDAIGAKRTLADLRKLRRAFEAARHSGQSTDNAPEAVDRSALGRAIARTREAHVREVEERLLSFCKAHVAELAAD
jgi:hypothetical protein